MHMLCITDIHTHEKRMDYALFSLRKRTIFQHKTKKTTPDLNAHPITETSAFDLFGQKYDGTEEKHILTRIMQTHWKKVNCNVRVYHIFCDFFSRHSNMNACKHTGDQPDRHVQPQNDLTQKSREITSKICGQQNKEKEIKKPEDPE